MPPHPRAETKNAEQHKYATGCHDQPIRQGAHQECLGTDAARHGDKASAYPRGIGPFSGEYGAVGSKLGAAVGTVLDARRARLLLVGLLFTAGMGITFPPLDSEQCSQPVPDIQIS